MTIMKTVLKTENINHSSFLHLVLNHSGSQSVVPGPAALATLGG